MIKPAMLRTALAAVALLGAVHLRTADAAETPNSHCTDEAVAIGTAICDEATGGNWEYGWVYWYEYEDGSCELAGVECYSAQ